MTRDDIIRMALEAGGCTPEWDDFWEFHERALVRFHAIAVAAEREAYAEYVAQSFENELVSGEDAAAAIRARNEQEQPR
jgi:hypothetical protein